LIDLEITLLIIILMFSKLQSKNEVKLDF